MEITETIRKQYEKVKRLETAIDEVIENGVSYSLQGSHSVTKANLADLQSQLSIERKALIAMTKGTDPRARIVEYPRYD